MGFKKTRVNLGIAAKLYWVAALSAAAVAVLVFASVHFARVTQLAATQLNVQGFAGIENSSRLQSLLAQHRQIVESAPAEVDRKRLEGSQREFIEKSAELAALVNKLNLEISDPIADDIELQMAQKLPKLFSAGQEVMYYAYNFAQDKAIEAAEAYGKAADNLQIDIRKYRAHRNEVAAAAVNTLMDSAKSLLLWVSVSALAAFLLIGPLGLAITRGVLRRLSRITKYMTRLANQSSAAEVPSQNDYDEVGDMARAVQVFKENAAELRERKSEIERVNTQLDLALNNMTHGLSMFDTNRRLTICNARYAEMYGFPSNLTKPGTSLTAIFNFFSERKVFADVNGETIAAYEIPIANGSGSVIRKLADGRLFSISIQSTSDGGWVAIHEDVTERRKAEAHIIHLARHDHLTGLPNRVFFREELDKGFRKLRRSQKLAVLCLDLDRFKAINDTLGHPVGDRLLSAVGKRLIDCTRENDFVARLGGDEFAVIQTDIERAEDCGYMAGRIIEKLSAPYEIDGQQLNIGASIGVAVAPQDGGGPDQLLKNADLAMYRAKADGRGSYRFFEQEMDARIQERRALETELRNALVAGELQLYYQPLVEPKSGEVRCFEALLRWFHPRLGEIPPSQFIPLAEESGLIGTIGEWVLRSACADAAKWPKRFHVAVNLSPIQFRNPNLVKGVFSSLAASGLEASRLELEITESLLLEDDVKTMAMLHELRELGIRIVMDDFGTGYSSLNYLRSFPFDKIKIDRSFVLDLSKGKDAVMIVKAIIDLARGLNIDVVAEGVETAEQLDCLISNGCNQVQGYYFSAPKPIKSFEKVLIEDKGRIEIAA